MGIADKIAGAMTQTALYWATPVPDGFGAYTYDDPVEIDCRWEEKSEVISLRGVGGKKGEEIVSLAQVYINQDVIENGYLFLGSLTDLDSAEEENPETVDGAYRIRVFEKLPEFKKTDKFLRRVYL